VTDSRHAHWKIETTGPIGWTGEARQTEATPWTNAPQASAAEGLPEAIERTRHGVGSANVDARIFARRDSDGFNDDGARRAVQRILRQPRRSASVMKEHASFRWSVGQSGVRESQDEASLAGRTVAANSPNPANTSYREFRRVEAAGLAVGSGRRFSCIPISVRSAGVGPTRTATAAVRALVHDVPRVHAVQ